MMKFFLDINFDEINKIIDSSFIARKLQFSSQKYLYNWKSKHYYKSIK